MDTRHFSALGILLHVNDFMLYCRPAGHSSREISRVLGSPARCELTETFTPTSVSARLKDVGSGKNDVFKGRTR